MEASTSVSIPHDLQDELFNCKSVDVYRNWHSKFMDFVQTSGLSETFESVIQFFHEVAKLYAPSTLWQAHCCLNKYYSTYKSWKSFNDLPILKNYLKKIEKESDAKKKSEILTKEQIFTFLKDAPDDPKYLVRKAVAICGYFGGLRTLELLQLDRYLTFLRV